MDLKTEQDVDMWDRLKRKARQETPIELREEDGHHNSISEKQ